MKTIEQLAQEAFEKAAAIIDRDRPPEYKCDPWDKLKPNVKEAWVAATGHVLSQSQQTRKNPPRQAPTECVRPNGLIYDLPPLHINAAQLREAVAFLGDDPDDDLELAFARRDEGKNIDDEIMAAGLYVWFAEYPEEGALYLDGTRPPVA